MVKGEQVGRWNRGRGVDRGEGRRRGCEWCGSG